MGSGISGNYSGTVENSQPYAETYSVTNDLLELDKQDSDIYTSNDGYFKNPSATNLFESIKNDGFYINGTRVHGMLPYVLTEEGKIVFGKRRNPNNLSKRAPHPTLVGGKNPKVKCAGMITFSKGKIISINNNSGHFKPNIQSMSKVYDIMNKLYKKYPNAFKNESKWRKK